MKIPGELSQGNLILGRSVGALARYLAERTDLLANRAIEVSEGARLAMSQGRSQPELKVEFSENQIT